MPESTPSPESTTSVADTHPAPQQPGLSGARVTQVVLVLFIASGLGLAYTLWVYNQIDLARDETREQWREMVPQLDQRYRDIEVQVAKSVDDGSIAIADGEEFRLLIDAFRTTAQPQHQLRVATELEQWLANRDGLPAIAADLAGSIDQQNELLQREQAWISSPAGRLIDVFVEFPSDQQLTLAK